VTGWGVGCVVDLCRKCEPCLKGLEQYCIEGATMTYNAIEKDGKTPTQGGYSEKIVVDENYVLSIPDTLSPDRCLHAQTRLAEGYLYLIFYL